MQLFEIIQEILSRHHEDVVMAWVQFLPAIVSGISAAAGGIGSYADKRAEERQMRGIENKVKNWNAENESWYNTEMNRDYTQTDEAKNMLRQLREEMDRQTARSGNNNIISGGTVEAEAADREGRSKALSNLLGNIGGMATAYKDRATSRYLNNQAGLRQLEMGIDQQRLGRLAENTTSSNNMFYNGLTGLAGQDWASLLTK